MPLPYTIAPSHFNILDDDHSALSGDRSAATFRDGDPPSTLQTFNNISRHLYRLSSALTERVPSPQLAPQPAQPYPMRPTRALASGRITHPRPPIPTPHHQLQNAVSSLGVPSHPDPMARPRSSSSRACPRSATAGTVSSIVSRSCTAGSKIPDNTVNIRICLPADGELGGLRRNSARVGERVLGWVGLGPREWFG